MSTESKQTVPTKKRLLIVDDDVSLQRAIKKAAEVDGYEVVQAFDGKNAWMIASEMHPDIVLLDVSLPELDGRDVLSRLKKSEETASIPVVVYSGRGEQQDRLVALGLGADEFIPKPVVAQHLVLSLDSVLRKRREQ